MSYIRSRNCKPFVRTWVHIRLFDGVRGAHRFSFLCCPIMCLYVQSFVFWCPLQFPHKHDVLFVFTSSCFIGRFMSYLRYLNCSGVQDILCCVFGLFFFVLSYLRYFCIQFEKKYQHISQCCMRPLFVKINNIFTQNRLMCTKHTRNKVKSNYKYNI